MSEITQNVLDLYSDRPRVALLMSGAGSNAEAILADEELRDLYDISVVITDNPGSRAPEIAFDHGLELMSMPRRHFDSPAERKIYFDSMASRLGEASVQGALFAGFMKIVSPAFCRDFPGVNVHPANLAIAGSDGHAKYRGMNALPDMRLAEGFVQASVHVVDMPVDTGTTLSLTPRIYPLGEEETNVQLHSRLKVHENHYYPETLRLIGRGEVVGSALPIMFEESA